MSLPREDKHQALPNVTPPSMADIWKNIESLSKNEGTKTVASLSAETLKLQSLTLSPHETMESKKSEPQECAGIETTEALGHPEKELVS